jgi:hypothetical protein
MRNERWGKLKETRRGEKALTGRGGDGGGN